MRTSVDDVYTIIYPIYTRTMSKFQTPFELKDGKLLY